MLLEIQQDLKLALENYYSSNSLMPLRLLNPLFDTLAKLNNFGVTSFGYRTIDHEGRSAVFSTSKVWNGIDKNTFFQDCMSEHMNWEVKNVKQHKLSFVTRSTDKENTVFLNKLGEYGVNNSVIYYNFLSDKVEMFYLLLPLNKPEIRDVILNNKKYIISLFEDVAPSLKFLTASVKFEEQKITLLKENTLKFVWQNHFTPQLNHQLAYKLIVYKEREIPLSRREFETLVMLNNGWSNKSIANYLNLSDLTIKDYIRNLKRKFSVQCRDMLTTIAQEAGVKYLNLKV